MAEADAPATGTGNTPRASMKRSVSFIGDDDEPGGGVTAVATSPSAPAAKRVRPGSAAEASPYPTAVPPGGAGGMG